MTWKLRSMELISSWSEARACWTSSSEASFTKEEIFLGVSGISLTNRRLSTTFFNLSDSMKPEPPGDFHRNDSKREISPQINTDSPGYKTLQQKRDKDKRQITLMNRDEPD